MTAVIPCPEPSLPSVAELFWRGGLEMGFRGDLYQGEDNIAWDGYEAGKFWRIRWGLYSATTGHYCGSKETREEAVRVAPLGLHFHPLPW